jgi:hypothetical protein
MGNQKTKMNKPKKGQKLHVFVAQGGKPSEYNKLNKTEKLRERSKQKLK